MSPRDAAEALLGSFTMRELRTLEHNRGIAWTGKLERAGKVEIMVTQQGHGGNNLYHLPGGRRADALVAELNAAGQALGLNSLETLDEITAALENGQTCLDGARFLLISTCRGCGAFKSRDCICDVTWTPPAEVPIANLRSPRDAAEVLLKSYRMSGYTSTKHEEGIVWGAAFMRADRWAFQVWEYGRGGPPRFSLRSGRSANRVVAKLNVAAQAMGLDSFNEIAASMVNGQTCLDGAKHLLRCRAKVEAAKASYADSAVDPAEWAAAREVLIEFGVLPAGGGGPA